MKYFLLIFSIIIINGTFSIPQTNVPLTEDSQERLFAAIAEYLDAPYKIGGITPKGVDCSALTQVIYEHAFNLPLPYPITEQYAQGENVNDINELLAGDLIFFNISTKDKPDHIGIYIGNAHFVHATINKGVIVSSIYDKNYYDSFLCGKRLMPTKYNKKIKFKILTNCIKHPEMMVSSLEDFYWENSYSSNCEIMDNHISLEICENKLSACFDSNYDILNLFKVEDFISRYVLYAKTFSDCGIVDCISVCNTSFKEHLSLKYDMIYNYYDETFTVKNCVLEYLDIDPATFNKNYFEYTEKLETNKKTTKKYKKIEAEFNKYLELHDKSLKIELNDYRIVDDNTIEKIKSIKKELFY